MENGYSRAFDFTESNGELMFDQEHHGRNVKIEDEGKIAQKLKK